MHTSVICVCVCVYVSLHVKYKWDKAESVKRKFIIYMHLTSLEALHMYFINY